MEATPPALTCQNQNLTLKQETSWHVSGGKKEVKLLYWFWPGWVLFLQLQEVTRDWLVE